MTKVVGLFVYAFFTNALVRCPREYQWILAGIASPLIREFNCWLLVTICQKASGKQEVDTVTLSATHQMETRHCLFWAVLAGTLATDETVYAIVGVDFLMNICYGLKIVYLMKYSSKENAKEEGKIQVEKQIISD